MILDFGDKETKKVWEGEFSRKLPIKIQQIARRKLRMIHRSQDLLDLIIPPSNNLEKLKGNLEGFYSIRINIQWRIIFIWDLDAASKVQIIDYHK
jgi:proteic killer suppression protein